MLPDTPVIDDVLADYPGGDGLLTVFVDGTTAKGSSKTEPYADGQIVKYVVTAQPEDGDPIIIEVAGETDTDGRVRRSPLAGPLAGQAACCWPACCCPQVHLCPGPALTTPPRPYAALLLADQAELPGGRVDGEHQLHHDGGGLERLWRL